MIKHILGTLLLTINTGANINVFPMISNKPQPPQHRLVSNFNLSISRTNRQTAVLNSDNKYEANYTWKLSANNDALLIKGNELVNNNYISDPTTSPDYGINIAVQGNDDPNLFTPKMLTIYQITTYENTQNVNQNYKITTLMGLQTFHYPNYNTNIQQIKIKTTTYTSQEDWSNYIDRNDYLTWNYIDTLKQEIESPNNGYRYTKTEQLTIATSSNTESTTMIETDINLTKATTTYMIQISQPVVVLQPEAETNTILLSRPEWHSKNFIYRAEGTTDEYITGQMIVPEGTQEIVDIPGLMFYILTMPFTFISGAFDLTLFPGTPYQVNIANLFMAIIAVMAFIFIITIIIKLKAGGGQ